jgi:hypothetical protein
MAQSSRKVAVEEDDLSTVTEEIRLRALDRLYLRREAVDALIRSLEAYQNCEPRKAPVISINAARMCW